MNRDQHEPDETPINLDDIPYSDGEAPEDVAAAIPIPTSSLPRAKDQGGSFYLRGEKNDDLFHDVLAYGATRKTFTAMELVGQCPSIATKKVNTQKVQLFAFLGDVVNWPPQGCAHAKFGSIRKVSHGQYKVILEDWVPGSSIDRRVGPRERRNAA